MVVKEVKVLVLSIASRGGVYDAMKAVLVHHANSMPRGWDHKFVYGGAHESDDPRDITMRDVEEGLGQGVTRKTLSALAYYADDYDYIVRTNMSTVWLWPRLRAFLDSAPRAGLVAGTVDPNCGPHICGCCMIWSRDVVRHLVAEHWDELSASEEPDDVVLSAVCRRFAAIAQVPRLDSVCGAFPCFQVHSGSHQWHDAVPHITHVRFKSPDRGMDVAAMRGLVRVIETQPDCELLLATHAAQCVAAAS